MLDTSGGLFNHQPTMKKEIVNVKNKPNTARKGTAAQVKATPQREDLAVLLAKVIAHPDLPHVMWEFITDGLCELDNNIDKYENLEVLRELLGLNRKGGAR
jgi:hypothetical protein